MTDKVAFLTGVSRGLGEALGKLFLQQGWRLVAIGRGEAPQWLIEAGSAALYIYCDLSDLDQVQGVAAAIEDDFDVIINSAAIFGGGAYYARDFSPVALETVLRTNVVAPALLARDLKPKLRPAGRRLVVMMSTGNASLAGNAGGEMLAYRLSKSALNQWVRTAAAEWRDERIGVFALNPGWLRTDMGGDAAPDSAEDGAAAVFRFVEEVASTLESGAFVNTDGSPLPW